MYIARLVKNSLYLIHSRNISITVKYKMSYEDPKLKHLFDLGQLNVYEKNVVNLSAGTPGPDLLQTCTTVFQKATEHRMKYEADHNYFLFQYGPTVGMYDIDVGDVGIAEFLTKQYNDCVNAGSLVLTNGATGGLHMILTTLVDMSAIIFVDDVTYMIALETMSQFSHMKIIPIKMSADGVDTDHLESEIEKHKFTSKDKLFWGLYYTIPTFHNPTGIVFSETVCSSLINIARKHDILIACDDVYNLLNYSETKSIKRLFAYDDQTDSNYLGNVISNCSFSKILSPGLRIGWMEDPPRCVKSFQTAGVLKSGGAVNNYTSGLISSLIQMGLMDTQLELYRTTYKTRMDRLNELLVEHLLPQCKFTAPTGGYFLWIELPEHVDGNEFNKYLLKNYKIVAIIGDKFSVKREFKNCIRLTIGFHSVDVLENATILLCKAIKEYICI